LSDYAALGGYMDSVKPLPSIKHEDDTRRRISAHANNPWPLAPERDHK